MIVLGLTGSIAMGKSTTAKMFAAHGVPVHDADATVHELYGSGGAGVAKIASLAPEAVGSDGVDRGILRKLIEKEPSLLTQIENLIHPLVAESRTEFIARHEAAGDEIVLLDLPLLFETDGASLVDYVIVVTANEEIQRRRALSRPNMTSAAFEKILGKQMPDAEKRRHADFIIDTSDGLESASAQVKKVLEVIKSSRSIEG